MYKGDLCLPYFYAIYIKTLDISIFMYYNTSIKDKEENIMIKAGQKFKNTICGTEIEIIKIVNYNCYYRVTDNSNYSSDEVNSLEEMEQELSDPEYIRVIS